jgi:hypothetical protein
VQLTCALTLGEEYTSTFVTDSALRPTNRLNCPTAMFHSLLSFPEKHDSISPFSSVTFVVPSGSVSIRVVSVSQDIGVIVVASSCIFLPSFARSMGRIFFVAAPGFTFLGVAVSPAAA